MTTVGLSALAAQSGLFGLGSALAADAPAADAKPRVRVVFLRPKVDRYWMGWPGACYDIKAREAEFTKIMTDAAEKLGVDLEVDAEPIVDMAGGRQAAGRVQAVAAGRRDRSSWAACIPTTGRTPTSSSPRRATCRRSSSARWARRSPATSRRRARRRSASRPPRKTSAGWPPACEMLRTIWDMKNTRLCIINGDKTEDQRLDVIGTTLHHIPLNRWTDELAKQEATDEVKALAEEFTQDGEEDRRAEAGGRDQRGEELLRGQADHGGRELPGDFAELPGPGRRPAAFPARRAWRG